jgi:hypothetical protein
MALPAGTVFLDGVEEADELLMAMALHALPDELAVEHVESGEERGRAVALVVMRHRPGSARRAGLVAKKAVDALYREALLPAPDDGLALARPPHDGGRAETVGCRQHDRGAPDMLLRAVAVRDNGIKPVTVRGGHFNGDPGAHTRTQSSPQDSQTDSSVTINPLDAMTLRLRGLAAGLQVVGIAEETLRRNEAQSRARAHQNARADVGRRLVAMR